MSHWTRMMSIHLTILSGLMVAIGIEPPSLKAQTPPTELSRERIQAHVEVELSGQSITQAVPLIVSINPKADLQAVLSRFREKATALRLTIQVRQPKDGDWSGFHVFLNSNEKELNDLQTPHRVGSVFFYGGTEGEPTSFMLELGHNIQHLKQAKRWRDGAPLRLTLVGIPGRSKQKSDSPEIVVTRVSITALRLEVARSRTQRDVVTTTLE